MLRARIATASIVATIGLVPGCGGGGGGSSTSTAARTTTAAPNGGPLSEDAYRKRATAICEELDRKVAALGDPNRIPLAVYWGRVVELGRPALRRLGALEPPPSLAPRARKAVALAGEEIRLIGEASKAMKASSDPQGVYAQRRPAIYDVISREDDLWLSLGITACSDSQLPGEGPA